MFLEYLYFIFIHFPSSVGAQVASQEVTKYCTTTHTPKKNNKQ